MRNECRTRLLRLECLSADSDGDEMWQRNGSKIAKRSILDVVNECVCKVDPRHERSLFHVLEGLRRWRTRQRRNDNHGAWLSLVTSMYFSGVRNESSFGT